MIAWRIKVGKKYLVAVVDSVALEKIAVAGGGFRYAAE
jgi:hypothetical protein